LFFVVENAALFEGVGIIAKVKRQKVKLLIARRAGK
jgi:hypothetical protein